MAAGIANPKEGKSGCDNCRDNSVVYLELLDTVGADNRGRKEDSIDRVETWAAAILSVRNPSDADAVVLRRLIASRPGVYLKLNCHLGSSSIFKLSGAPRRSCMC